jgi:branched-chain amino acid transport system substrate-binding protein
MEEEIHETTSDRCTVALLIIGIANTASAHEIKLAYIDPLSGGGASVGEIGLKTFQFLADEINAKGGLMGQKLVVIPFDNKTNPQESLVQAQKAIDSGIRFITTHR